jgi:formate-dependent nitrite reductase membrane component NrfD
MSAGTAPAFDGRDIDTSRGALRGEGAPIRVKDPDHAYPTIRDVPGSAMREDADPTYYDEPVIKAPVWEWPIALYLFLGGVAGGSAALGAAAHAIDPDGLRPLVRRAHQVSAIGDVVSAGLLVYDLGRPARFLNMLRVFRPTSPMSVGAWVLTGSGAASTLAAILGEQRGALGRVGAVSGLASGVLGLALAGYTGVLLTNTAVPVWQGGRRALPPLFLASAATSTGALLHLLPVGRKGRAAARAFAVLGGAAELVLVHAYEREVARSRRAARPLHRGASGAIFQAARVLTGASVLLSIAPPRATRRTRALADALGLAGALGLRTAVFLAGKASARDPRATFHQQREGLGAAEVTGQPVYLARS